MDKQNQESIEKLKYLLDKFTNLTVQPSKDDVEDCIKEIYSQINRLNEDDNPYISHELSLKGLYDLANLVCDFAEIFENKFPNSLNALNFRNMELKIAKQYKTSGGKKFWRSVWEIYLDISTHYSSLNIDVKSLNNAKTALNLFQKSKSKNDLKKLSYIYRRIAFAYQDINPNEAIIYFNKSNNILAEYNKTNETYENFIEIAINDINIAILMYKTNQLDESISLSENTISLFYDVNSKYGENESTVRYLAIIHSIMARSYFELNEYDAVIKATENGVLLYNKLAESNSVDSCEVADMLYSIMSLTFRNQKKYMEAIEIQYKLLSIWMQQEEGFVRSCRICDIYVDISLIYSKYLNEYNIALEIAKLSVREINPYLSENLLISSKKALSTRRRCFINLADIYYRGKMYWTAVTAYKSALKIIEEELSIESEKISVIYSYAYSLYQLAMLEFQIENIPDGCKYLNQAYRNATILKKYGGRYEMLFDAIRESMNIYDRDFDNTK